MRYVLSTSPLVGDIIAVFDDREEAIDAAKESFNVGNYGTLLMEVQPDFRGKAVEVRYHD